MKIIESLSPECELENTMRQRGKKEAAQEQRFDIKRTRRLSTLDFIFYTRGEKRRERKREEKSGVKSAR